MGVEGAGNDDAGELWASSLGCYMDEGKLRSDGEEEEKSRSLVWTR